MGDDPWDDWEAAADAGLDPKPSKAADEHEKNKQLWQEANAYVQPEIVRTDTTRTEYVPQLRILKRPKNPGPTTTTHTGDNFSISSLKKSLAEREAKYNVARQKIFGTNTNSDDNNNGESVITGSEGQILDDKKDILQIKDGSKLWEENIHYHKPKSIGEKRIVSPANSQTEGSDIIRQPISPNYGQMGGFNRMKIIKNQKS
ncbi:uncharacterized protein OCT59_005403 [Rhizophagus irregularis]|uniref:SUZ domain-containing protein n=2 Tax=Rhizophagus irregularis TaxID=588596 RepID=A0A015KBA0_RHIIW|nr:hypothetical protein GLOIN_2v506832 [Rhizophagus irregularis DAOM 181602=DAOM 197198]EXX79062.1 hypothetical protein RirG_009250 [Rhizophagus irregularis DAOM 197198w]UZO13927.1 hypothetical protein OCT59_005403 [Rhizophagus irregularis]POG63981.1 hypothetical protein GLOIN_2v506832 [Rhizophagus irregularis DAOM 181602=DAOM 197198]CAG8437128.1 13936_t:CDS:2 [Rhizophagus irregularis]GBC45972.1 SUZ domain-containing protein 1-like [Rhizophagus irregularis DAOM 181602=DAOM 197198]|eukprot:XP_025170847.1 hypothetical protein GLOIN_2v506832 [Rhizophagus irregularis DAOM 181602=DAOM 197198]